VPISLAESGPAAGVAAAVEVARAAAVTEAVTCDMGGTSFDVAVVSGGQATRRSRGDLMGIWTALSLVDVDSIGAGGGSVGWTDARGMLRVGPHSAGAVPGPACYGRGGLEPTVTDALLVLGYLAPDRFLGGDMGLDADAATAACARLGEELALSADDVAWGIREIALVGMAKAVRGRLAERGLDPRGRSLVSFGGCGGLFAADIAHAIGMDTVVVPELASVLSAFGAATADVRRERAQSLEMAFPVDIDAVAVIAEKLRGQVDADVAADGVAPVDRSVVFEADLRFKRQKWELTVPLTGALAGADGFDQLIADFRAEYARRYGEGALMAGAVVELVSVRAIGTGRTVKPDLTPTAPTEATGGAPSRASVRSVRVARGTAPISVDVFVGDDLRAGHEVSGPALIDGVDTTVWIPPDRRLRVDSRNNFIVEVN
jgi:N-methylhydantoinase A